MGEEMSGWEGERGGHGAGVEVGRREVQWVT